jgi:hypothetical protein
MAHLGNDAGEHALDLGAQFRRRIDGADRPAGAHRLAAQGDERGARAATMERRRRKPRRYRDPGFGQGASTSTVVT